jgi:hypothetical protein
MATRLWLRRSPLSARLLFIIQDSYIYMDSIVAPTPDWQETPAKTHKSTKLFIVSASIILILTAVAKIVSAFGSVSVLDVADPLFGIPFRHLMLAVGVTELIVAAICLCTKNTTLSIGLIAWIATQFLLYRFALWAVGWQKPCGCLGHVTDALNISAHTADWIMKGALTYLFAGSWFLLSSGYLKKSRVSTVRAAAAVAMFLAPAIAEAQHGQQQVSATTQMQVSNIVAFIRGDFAISHIDVGVDGKFYSIGKFVAPEPIFFEAAFQTNTYYIRKSWTVVSNAIVPATNTVVFGANLVGFWAVKGSDVFLSVKRPEIPPDPMMQEVADHRHLAGIPLRLGFPENIIPVRLEAPTRLRALLADGSEIVGTLTLKPDGLIKTFTYGLSNANMHGQCVLEYFYEGGLRPNWMPSKFTVTADETQKNGKTFKYSDTHYVRSCTLGSRDLSDGYQPEIFLPKTNWNRVLAWTNGVAFKTERGVTEPLPAHDVGLGNTMSPKRTIWMRAIVATNVFAVAFLCYRAVRRQSASKTAPPTTDSK